MTERQLKIEAARRKQPPAELERKFRKSNGRHSKVAWTAEACDFVIVSGENWANWILAKGIAPRLAE